MEIFTQNLHAETYPDEIQINLGSASESATHAKVVTAGATKIPNSLEICSRPLGDVESPIMADGHLLQPGDIILSRARTLSMHAIIALGQIYKFSWDTDNSFRFWSHPAMIVAVAGQRIRSDDGSKEATVTEDVLVQATVNPKGVNYALLREFRKAYSSRCWIFSPQRFDEPIRPIVVKHAENEEGDTLFAWLEKNNLLADITRLTQATEQKDKKSDDARHFTYGLLSLASILVSQVFARWRFRFFNEGQVTCSGFVAELLEKANYVFPSEIHAFPGDVAEQLYADFQDHIEMRNNETAKESKGGSQGWINGVANLRKQISADRKVMVKNATSFRLSSGAVKALLSMIAIGAVSGWAISEWLWPYVQNWPWLIRFALAGFSIYAIAIAAPITYYALRAFLKIAFVGIPQLIAMLRPLYWRRPSDLL